MNTKHILPSTKRLCLACYATLMLCSASAQTALLTSYPKTLQLYPRTIASNAAAVVASGSLTTAGYDSLIFKVFRNNIIRSRQATKLNYAAGSAFFTYAYTMTADTANYKYQLFAKTGTTESLVPNTTADSVVAGDVYLIAGQSNASARAIYGGAANPTNKNAFIRTYGFKGINPTNTATNMNWYVASGDNKLADTANAVGQWGLKFARLIKNTYAVPVAIINGADYGQTINFFQRNDANPADISTNYGRLLIRTINASVKNNVRGILYYQGESDNGNVATHYAGLEALRNDWKIDYPNLTKVYIFQVNEGCTRYAIDPTPCLRNVQRTFANTHADVEIISTSANMNGIATDTCHYNYTGNQTLAQRAFYLAQRDFYNATGPTIQNIEAPNIDDNTVTFTNASKNEVLMTMRLTDPLTIVGTAFNNDFKIEGTSGITVTNVSIVAPNKIKLTLSGNAAATTGLTYKAHQGNASGYVVNSRGIGLLAFCNIPIVSVPLSVNLIDFSARLKSQNTIQLYWATTDETNNKGFEMQMKKLDTDQDFETIGFVKGKNTSNQTQIYNFTTNQLSAGTYLFRLKQIDYDGKQTLSKTVKQTIEPKGNEWILKLQPNPTTNANNTNLAIQLAQNQALTIRITDAYGKNVGTISTANLTPNQEHLITIDTQNYAKGLYLVEITSNQNRETIKMMIQ